MQQSRLLKLLPLFFVIVIDSMGLGILFPILSDLFMDAGRGFMSLDSSVFTRELWFGITIGIYMIAWFFGSAALGDLSDAVGRKKSLLLCMLGATTGYLISAVGIVFHSLSLLIIGRVIAGFTAGSQPIAQAAIIDVSPEAYRARNIGYVLLAVSAGFILGPFIGGIFSDVHIVPWFNDATPLFFAGLLSLLNYALLLFFFHETAKKTEKISIRLAHPIKAFVDAFGSRRIRLLSVVLFFETVGWAEYYTYISQFLLRRFDYSVTKVSFFMTVLAIGFSVGFGLLVNPCAQRFNLRNCVIANMLFAALLFLVTVAVKITAVIWVCAIFVGISIAILYSLLITLFSNQVSAAEQGWVMGITNSVGALSFGFTALISGFAADWGAAVPIYLGVGGLVLAAIVLRSVDLTKVH